jgi:hypothetical protein
MANITFRVTGSFEMDSNIKDAEEHSPMQTCSFKLPDGRVVRLVVALEVENPCNNAFAYLTKESDMTALGFTCLDYDETVFQKEDY